MQLPEYNRADAKWDEYKRFYTRPVSFLVHFDSGEAIITQSIFKPFYRRTIARTDLQITSTGDDDCPRLKFDPKAPDATTMQGELLAAGHDVAKAYERPLPRVWVCPGWSQTLLVDHTTKRTVQLHTSRTYRHAAWAHVPTQFNPATGYGSNAVAYIPGNGRDAIASKVHIKLPIVPDSDMRRALRKLGEGCTAWCSLLDGDTTKWAKDWYAQDNNEGWKYRYHRPFDHKGDVPDIGDLSPEQRFQIARFGYARRYKHIYTDHLLAQVS